MPTAPPSIPKSKSKALPMVMIAIGIIAIIGLALYYFFKDRTTNPNSANKCGAKVCKSNEQCRSITAPNGDTLNICVPNDTSGGCIVERDTPVASRGIGNCNGVPYNTATHMCINPCPNDDIASRILLG